MIKIIPLSKKHLDEAISLAETIFPYKEDQRIARINLVESLSQKSSGKTYWVAKNTDGRILGLAGLYLDEGGKSIVWLGWFGVHPIYRRKGVGSLLLEYAIKESKTRGFKILKIYTSTDESETAAHQLYESYRFVQSNSKQDPDIIIYSLQ